MDQDPAAFWDEVFSRDPARIRSTLERLPAEERASVVAHLRRMVEEEGWHEDQREAARAALHALEQTRDP